MRLETIEIPKLKTAETLGETLFRSESLRKATTSFGAGLLLFPPINPHSTFRIESDSSSSSSFSSVEKGRAEIEDLYQTSPFSQNFEQKKVLIFRVPSSGSASLMGLWREDKRGGDGARWVPFLFIRGYKNRRRRRLWRRRLHPLFSKGATNEATRHPRQGFANYEPCNTVDVGIHAFFGRISLLGAPETLSVIYFWVSPQPPSFVAPLPALV